MKESLLLKKMFEMQRWEELLKNAVDKKISLKDVRVLSAPQNRFKLYEAIVTGNYEIMPPHIARIPKDNGDFREVYVNENIDRIVLTLINDVLCEIFSDMIHKSCKSYQKGIGCGEVVQKVSKEITNKSNGNTKIGYKSDLSKYFDTVPIEIIDKVFDKLEDKLGFECQTEPVINILRNYYHNDYVFDADGNLVKHYGSLKQGCAVAAFLSNVVLYDIDDTLSKMDILYYRYSDDTLIIGKEADKAKAVFEKMLKEKGLKLNPKKVETLYSNKWFTFLGFKIKGSMITLSKNRVKHFQKEIESRTIKKKKISSARAKRNVIDYLYKGKDGYCWATSCLSIINVKKDIDELNKFIMDCIRACETGKKKIGGLGSINDKEDFTILRGCGKNVKSNREKTNTKIENYLSVGCLSNGIKINKSIFETLVRTL